MLYAHLNTCKCFSSIVGFQQGCMFSCVLAINHLSLSLRLPVVVMVFVCVFLWVCGCGREAPIGRKGHVKEVCVCHVERKPVCSNETDNNTR